MGKPGVRQNPKSRSIVLLPSLVENSDNILYPEKISVTIQFLLFTHSDFEHGSINCSPVDPVVIRRNDKHCFSGFASVPSNLQASKDEKVKKLNSTTEMSSLY